MKFFAGMPTARTTSLLALLTLSSYCTVCLAEDPTVAALRQEVEALKARLEVLERRNSFSMPVESLNMETAVSGADRSEKGLAEEEEDSIHIGGTLRFNLGYREGVDASESKRGESGLDVFRLNVDGAIDNILISAEYRFYPYMDVIHHGWIGYEFTDNSQVHVGISQVPFGILPYASHNFWYGVPYFVGLADDYDVGVKYIRHDGPWNTQLAFYKNSELNDATNLDRFGFDLVRVGEQQNEETNQINARLAYTFGMGSNCESELGASYQASQVYNTSTNDRGDHWAAMLHLDSRCGRWGLQLQGGSYEYNPENPPGVDSSIVRIGAFADAYDIDSNGDIVVANLAYNFSSPWDAIDSITCYNDYSRLFKSLDDATDSQVNTIGCLVGVGPLYTYIDYVYAKNMPYFGEGSLSIEGEDDWKGRFNINVGYYW